MSSTRVILPAVLLLAITVAGGFRFWPASTGDEDGTGVSADASAVDEEGTSASSSSASPFAVSSGQNEVTLVGPDVSETSVDRRVLPGSVLPPAALTGPVDVSQIALTPLNDAEFEALVLRLRADPELLRQLIDEFRQVQDPERRALLARILGEAGGSDVTLTASELIFSGDPASRKLGLSLLQAVQPGNAEARDIASGLLATEIEPEVLIDTMTTLAKPGNADPASRRLLAGQVALLSTHEDPGVRRISLDILSRWSKDGSDTPVLLGALDDPEYRVRQSAAYAFVGHEDTSQAVIDSLWAVASNDNEEKAVRRGAILALRGMPIGDARLAELDDIERRLDTVVRR